MSVMVKDTGSEPSIYSYVEILTNVPNSKEAFRKDSPRRKATFSVLSDSCVTICLKRCHFRAKLDVKMALDSTIQRWHFGRVHL